MAKKKNDYNMPLLVKDFEVVLQNLAEKSGVDPSCCVQQLVTQAYLLFEKEAEFWKGDTDGFLSFLEQNGFVLTENDYLRATVVALSLVHQLASTHYGTSQQRDFGQKWANLIEGLLGEIAFSKTIGSETKGRVVPFPDASRLDLKKALSGDITEVLLDGKVRTSVKKSISIKTTKLGGYWLDVPYAQVNNSELFVLVKVGLNQSSLFEFLARQKALSPLLERYRTLIQSEPPVFVSEEEALGNAEKFIKEVGGRSVYLAVVSGWQKREELNKTFEAKKYRITTKYITVFEGLGKIPGKKKLEEKEKKLLGKHILFDSEHQEGLTAEEKDKPVRFHPIGEFSLSDHTVCSIGCLERSLGDLVKELI